MKQVLLSLLAAAALGAVVPAHAQGGGAGLEMGSLSCHVRGGWGWVLGSQRPVDCTYTGQGRVQEYQGAITTVGVDLGYQQSGTILWSVIAPSTQVPGDIGGTYVGARGGATVGVGAGANVLIGGSGNHISLQPVSIEGMTGFNVAAGLGGLTLHAVPLRPETAPA